MATISTTNSIPVMTSNTAPSGVVSASSVYQSANDSYKAFDRNASNVWYASSVVPSWISYEFSNPINIKKYVIVGASGLETRMPKDWTFEGSNDGGITWTVLDTQTNILSSFWSVSPYRKECIISVSNSYKKYRVNISTNNGHATLLGLQDIEMYEINYLNKILISFSSGESRSLANTDGGSLIPNMTSYTSSSGTVIYSSEFNVNYHAWMAFNGVYDAVGVATSTGWLTASGILTGYIGYKFMVKKIIDKYIIYPRGNTLDSNPMDFTFEGSNDDFSTFDVLDTQVGKIWLAGTPQTFTFKNVKSYQSYRVNISKNGGNVNYSSVQELQMYEAIQSFTKILNTTTEQIFINHGMDRSIVLDLSTVMSTKQFVEQSPTTFGSGKVFSKSIDTSIIPINGVSIK